MSQVQGQEGPNEEEDSEEEGTSEEEEEHIPVVVEDEVLSQEPEQPSQKTTDVGTIIDADTPLQHQNRDDNDTLAERVSAPPGDDNSDISDISDIFAHTPWNQPPW